MVRKVVTFIGLLIVSLGLTAFSGSARPAAQAGGTSPVIQVLLILGIIILFVLLEWLVLWWLRRRSEAAQASTAPAKVVAHAVPPKVEAPAVKAAPAVPIAEPVQPAPVAEPVPPAPVAEAVKAAPLVPDDLKIIEGIGPKIAGILAECGITTFAQLAETDVSRLKEIIAQAGLTALADPTTWPQQAGLAAAGKMDELEVLQGQLKGGRRAK